MENRKHIQDDFEKRQEQLPNDLYFSSLKAAILSQTKPVRQVRFYSNPWFISLAAAAVVVLFILPLTWKGQQETNSPDWASVSKEELYAYVSENIGEFDTEDISNTISVVSAENVQVELNHTQAVTSNKDNELFGNIDKTEILDYLEEEVVELDDETITGY